MSKIYSPKIVTDSLVMCLDASNNKSYPTDLPLKDQLNLWLDAADDTTFSYSSGTTVSQWRDKSGQNNHAVVMGGSPSRSVAINSRKAVSFTSTTSFKCVTGAFISTATHIVVCRATTSSATYQRVYHGGANTDLYVFIGALANNIATFWGNGSSWNDVNANSPSITILNTLRIISAINTGTSATPYYDGTAMTVKSTNPAAYTGYELNTYATGNLQPLVGEVCEIIVFNKQLSTTELKQVHTYLGQKWGISNTDRSIVDLSGFNDNGLLGNGTTANMPLYDYYNKGSFLFDGSNDYIVIPNSSSLKSTSTLTVEAWVLISSSMNYYGAIVGKGVSDTNEEYCLLVHYVNNKVYFDVGSGGGPYVDASYTFALNTWYHISATHLRASGSSDIKIYINGSQVSGTVVNPTNAVNDNTDNVTIGSRFTTPTSIWNGKIGSVKIYNRNLSATEILQNYEAQKSKFANTIVQQGLVLNIDAANPYSYGGAGTTVYDVSNTALSWTASNITYNTDPIKYFSFNGSNSSLVSSTSSAYDSQTITMECWFYPNALAQNGFLFEKGAVNTQYSMFLNGDGTFYFRTYSSTTENNLTFTLSSYVTVSTWTHIACVYSSGTKTIYINGTQITQSTGAGAVNTGQTNQYIGKYGNAADNYPFNGRIAESRVYNIALSAAQVVQNYNATKTKYGL
jgi:hypothetical protein